MKSRMQWVFSPRFSPRRHARARAGAGSEGREESSGELAASSHAKLHAARHVQCRRPRPRPPHAARPWCSQSWANRQRDQPNNGQQQTTRTTTTQSCRTWTNRQHAANRLVHPAPNLAARFATERAWEPLQSRERWPPRTPDVDQAQPAAMPAVVAMRELCQASSPLTWQALAFQAPRPPPFPAYPQYSVRCAWPAALPAVAGNPGQACEGRKEALQACPPCLASGRIRTGRQHHGRAGQWRDRSSRPPCSATRWHACGRLARLCPLSVVVVVGARLLPPNEFQSGRQLTARWPGPGSASAIDLEAGVEIGRSL